jgi:hypothetical protein
MFDTNALLSIAFSMIASFTNIVEVPPEAVPTQPGDLQRCVIGRPGSGPGSALHLILTHRKGTEFWIGNGAIYAYSSPGSFFTLQDPSLVPNFMGTTKLTSNDVVQIAEKALRQLVKSGNPLGGGPPKVQQASEYQGRRIPFFRVTWPKPTPGDPVARVEIDGRTGRIVCLDLLGDGFKDLAFQEEIKKKVNAPETIALKPQPAWINFPKPTPEDVTKAIAGWLAFCRVLGLEPGAQTNLADVDWNSSRLSPSSGRGVWSNGVCVVHACRIGFKSGARFDSAAGVVSSHFSADGAYYHGNDYRQAGEWKPFEGTPTKPWQEAAKELEARIIEQLGVQKSFFERLHKRLRSPVEDPPGQPLKRAIVAWRLLPPRPESPIVAREELQLLQICAGRFGFVADGKLGLSPDERAFAEFYWRSEKSLGHAFSEEYILDQMPDLLIAEFDLQTDQIKGLEFCFSQMFWPCLSSIPRL